MTLLLANLDKTIKMENKYQNSFELAISWTPDPNNEKDKRYTWELVTPDYPNNIMSLEDFFESYFENRETSTQIDSFFKSLKKTYINIEVSEEESKSIFELMKNFLVRYVNKFLIYTNKIQTPKKLEDLYKLYVEYTDESMITYIKNYAGENLGTDIVDTSETGFYIAKKRDSEEYVWIFITEKGELIVHETMIRGFNRIYKNHPYDEFFTLENFFDKYIKGSIEIEDVEQDKFFKLLSPEKLKERELQYEDIFRPFFEGNSTKNLFRTKNVPKPEKLSERLFRLQELYYKFDKIKVLAELAELKNEELNQDYLNFLQNKIGTEKADAELFKECGEPELYINTTDNKLYLGYCGIFQGYYNSIDDREKFYPPPTSPPAQSLIELYDLETHIEQLETLEIDCHYKTSKMTDILYGDWDIKCRGDIQKNLDKIRKKILENISNKNDLITINNAQKIYNFLFNNFHIKGKDENENEKIGEIMKNDFLKDIHNSVEKMEVRWNVNELGILYKQGVTTTFHPADKIKNMPGGWPAGQVFEEDILKKLSKVDLDKDMNVEAIRKHRSTWWIKTPLKIKINEFLNVEISNQNKEVNKENIKVYSEYEPQLFQKMFNNHLQFLEFVIGEGFDIFFKIIFEDTYYINKYYKVGTEEVEEEVVEFIGNLNIETTKKIIDKLITAIDYLEIPDKKIGEIIFRESSKNKKNDILNNTSLNLDDTVELIKHINQQQSNANSYFLKEIKAASSKRVKDRDSEFLNRKPPEPPKPDFLNLNDKSIEEVERVHFNEIKKKYEKQKREYIDACDNYNSEIIQLNRLISIIDNTNLLDIINPEEEWKKATMAEQLEELYDQLVLNEKAQLMVTLGKAETGVFEMDENYYVKKLKSLMVLLIKNIHILLVEDQFESFMAEIKKIPTEKLMPAYENITIETFSSYIANENEQYNEDIEEPNFFGGWKQRHSGMITFQKLIKTLFDSNDVFKFSFNGYEWSWNGVSQEIINSTNPYKYYKTFFDNIARFKKEFLDKTQKVQGKTQKVQGVQNESPYKYYITLIKESSFMKYKDSLYIIFILVENDVENFITTLPENGRGKNILNKFIENIIENIRNNEIVNNSKFKKGLDILYKMQKADYIEIFKEFEEVILKNYQKILEFIDPANKPQCIEDIEEKYFKHKHLQDAEGNIYYEKPVTITPFSKTPFILKTDKTETYHIKTEIEKAIIKVKEQGSQYSYEFTGEGYKKTGRARFNKVKKIIGKISMKLNYKKKEKKVYYNSNEKYILFTEDIESQIKKHEDDKGNPYKILNFNQIKVFEYEPKKSNNSLSLVLTLGKGST